MGQTTEGFWFYRVLGFEIGIDREVVCLGVEVYKDIRLRRLRQIPPRPHHRKLHNPTQLHHRRLRLPPLSIFIISSRIKRCDK